MLPPFQLWFNWRLGGARADSRRRGRSSSPGTTSRTWTRSRTAYFVVKAGRRPAVPRQAGAVRQLRSSGRSCAAPARSRSSAGRATGRRSTTRRAAVERGRGRRDLPGGDHDHHERGLLAGSRQDRRRPAWRSPPGSRSCRSRRGAVSSSGASRGGRASRSGGRSGCARASRSTRPDGWRASPTAGRSARLTDELMDGARHAGGRPPRPISRALDAGVGWAVPMTDRARSRVRDAGDPRRRRAAGRAGHARASRSSRPRRSASTPPRSTPRRSTFRRPGYTYTRGYGNPTLLAFERVMAELEGTESALSFASGMAAIHTVVTTLGRGRRPDRGEHRALRRHLLAVRQGPASVRHRRALRGPARPRTRSRAALPGADALLRRDDREPERHRRRPARRSARVPRRRRRPERGRQHVRVAVPVQPGGRSGSTTSCTRRPSTSAATTT